MTEENRTFTDATFLDRVKRQLDAYKASDGEQAKARLAQAAFGKAVKLVNHTGRLHAIYLSKDLFDDYLSEFSKQFERAGASKALIRNYRSGLNFVQKQVVLAPAFQRIHRLNPSRLASLSLGEALKVVCEHFEPHLTLRQFAERAKDITGIGAGTLRDWMYNGRQPKSVFRPQLAKLEQRYRLREGTLQSKCALVSAASKKRIGRRDNLVSSIELPVHVRHQIAEVVNFKVKGRAPNRPAAFDDDPDLPIEIRGGKKWTVDGSGMAASGVMFMQAAQRYLTWLIHAKGYSFDMLDLGLLCRLRLLKEYKDAALMALEDHGGDNGSNDVLQFVGVMLEAEDSDCFPVSPSSAQQLLQLVRGMVGTGGFLSNYYRPDDVTVERWLKEQAALQENLKVWLHDLKGEAKRYRQSRETTGRHSELVGGASNIQPLLELGPEKALAGWKTIYGTLHATAKNHLASSSNRSAAPEKAFSSMMVAVWMAMALETPLRSKNWALLRISDAPSPNEETLIKNGDSYTLNIPAVWLKTRRATVSVRPINHTYQPATCKLISEYLEVREARLAITQVEDHGFFLMTPRKCQCTYTKTKAGKEGNAIGSLITRQTGRAMQQLWPDQGWPASVGINMHSCRHAVQAFTEHVTGDIMASAAILGDSPQTTIAHYRDNTGMDGRRAASTASLLVNYNGDKRSLAKAG